MNVRAYHLGGFERDEVTHPVEEDVDIGLFDPGLGDSEDGSNEDPAPVVYAHGIAWVVVARDSVVLSGRQHAAQMAALSFKSDRNIKNTASAFTVGLIAAPASFLRIQTFRRQLEQHAEPASLHDPRFPKEGSVTACDTMTTDH